VSIASTSENDTSIPVRTKRRLQPFLLAMSPFQHLRHSFNLCLFRVGCSKRFPEWRMPCSSSSQPTIASQPCISFSFSFTPLFLTNRKRNTFSGSKVRALCTRALHCQLDTCAPHTTTGFSKKEERAYNVT
jgi:hypothetical protein